MRFASRKTSAFWRVPIFPERETHEAFAFGGAAVAQAQIGDPMSVTKDGEEYVRQDDNGGSTYIYDKRDDDGNLVERKAISLEEARQIRDAELGNDNAGTTDGEAGTDGSNVSEPDNSEGASDSEGNGSEGGNSEGSQEEGIPAPATIELEDGTVCYQHIQDKSVYVENSNEVNTEITDETVGKCKDANAGTTDPEGSSELSDAAKAGIGAAIALPILGGIVHYFLNKGGKTWVKSQDRVNAEPTPEEKAESEKIVAEHEDEINAQLAEQGQGNNAEGTAPAAGESADSARGMSAETGSNSVAQALAVAAMVAAGAFAARRKFFA